METSNLPYFEDDRTYFVIGNCRRVENFQGNDDSSVIRILKKDGNLIDRSSDDSSNSSSSLSTRSPMSSDKRIVFENRRFDTTGDSVLEKCAPETLSSASTKSDSSPPSLNDFDRLLENTMHLMQNFSRQYVGVEFDEKSSSASSGGKKSPPLPPHVYPPTPPNSFTNKPKTAADDQAPEIGNFVKEMLLETEKNDKANYSATRDICVPNSNTVSSKNFESNSTNLEAMADFDFSVNFDTRRLEPILVRFDA